MLSDRIAGRLMPFAAVAFIAYALSFALGPAPRLLPLTLSAALTCTILAVPMCVPRSRLPRALAAVLPVLCFVAIALLRWSAGGSVSGYGPLFMLPVLWLALYGSKPELAAGLSALLATLFTSDALLGNPGLGATELRRTILLVAVATVTGISVKQLVDETRSKRRALGAQAAMLQEIERRARESRDLFGGVLAAATECAIIATDPRGLITVFNQGAEQMLGYAAGEMVGRRSLETIHLEREIAEQADKLALEPGFEVLSEAARFGIAETREWTYVRRDGRHVPVSATVTAMRDDEDELTGFIVIAADITLRRMEQARTRAIIASQSEIASAGNEAHAVMQRIADRALSLTRASGATVEIPDGEDMTHALAIGSLVPFADMRLPSAGSLSGLCLAEQRILSCEDSESDERVEREACRRIGARSMVVVPLRHDGAALAVLKVISPQPYAFSDSDVDTLELLANLMGAAIAHAEDYARVANANEQLRELDRLKDGFVATVSHELRTPLASIIAYTEMLADGDAGALNAQQERMVSAVERNSRRLLALIENLLAINQIEAGALETTLAPTEPRLVVEAVGEALRPAAEAASIELRVDVSDEVGMLLADAAQLDRALMNVVANAIKFSLPGGTVDLVARRDAAGALEIEVSDQGIGIAPEDQERMFTRFFRASSAQERAIPGSGLGLAIVKEIIERHGGEVSLTSALGEGTRVTLRLPTHAATTKGTCPCPVS